MYYYDVTVHHNVVNNQCYDTKMKSFESLDEAIQWAKNHWSEEFHHNEDFSSDFVGDIVYQWVDTSDEFNDKYDLLLIRRMRRL